MLVGYVNINLKVQIKSENVLLVALNEKSRITKVITSQGTTDVCSTLNGSLSSSCPSGGPMDEQIDRLNSIAISRAMLLMWQKNKQVSMERT